MTPSHFAARFYRETLGLEAVVLPHPVDRDRILVRDPNPTYLTFVNPSVEKGVFVFARIADELGKRRPEIPLLVVESRPANPPSSDAVSTSENMRTSS